MPDFDKFAVWWVTDNEVCWLMQDQPPRPYYRDEGALFTATFYPGPEYVRDQLESRNGRHGRGRLWVDESLNSGIETLPGMPTAFVDAVDICGGIVVRYWDLDAICSATDFLGVVTDCYGYVLYRDTGRTGKWIRDERASPGKPNPHFSEQRVLDAGFGGIETQKGEVDSITTGRSEK
jgi:hypothetical protein